MNDAKRDYTFHVFYEDGREEDIAVRAASYYNAVYALPVLGRRGHYVYTGKEKRE